MVNVCVIGAAGGIGQPLSLLLMTHLPPKSTLSLYDLAGVHGVAAELSHVDRDVTIRSEQGALPPIKADPKLSKIAKGVDVFVIVAGVPRKPGMTRDDLFKVNAGILLDIVQTCAKSAPEACFCVVTNPVNAIVPIASKVLKKLGVYNKNKLFGVTQLDITRATKFVNDLRKPYMCQTQVPVVGGHSDVTIVPLFSQVIGPSIYKGANKDEFMHKLAVRVQNAGTEVVKAKAGKGSATLSMAFAGATFALKVVEGITGKSNPLVYAYVDTSDLAEGSEAAGAEPYNGGDEDTSSHSAASHLSLPTFFALPVLLGKGGIIKRYCIGKTNEAEKKLLDAAIPAIKKNIQSGESFANSKL